VLGQLIEKHCDHHKAFGYFGIKSQLLAGNRNYACVFMQLRMLSFGHFMERQLGEQY